MNKNTFFYEHIGHMQFSVLTLRTLSALETLTNGKEETFVSWEIAKQEIEKFGFSARQANGELERFCYGFECVDRFSDTHEIALTHIGASFLKYLLEESPYQDSQIAFLVRKAKRRNYWNAIVQESTFFNPEIYRIISDFKFRSGGARDFIRSIPIDELIRFLSLVSDSLSSAPVKPDKESLKDAIAKVEKYGKYWASVGGRYSWFVFTQKFELPFSPKDWKLYDDLMTVMIRPPEWGGGVDMSYEDLVKLLENKERLLQFREEGIIRPVWTSHEFEKSKFRLTAPGYLMWERKNKGFLFEFHLRKLSGDKFELALCNASDFPENFLSKLNMAKNNIIPSLIANGSKDTLLKVVSKIKEASDELGKLRQRVLY